VGQGNTLQFHVRSHVGRKRSTNQDSATVVPAETIKAYRDHGWLLIVADGMGAHAGGEEASRLAVSTVPDFYSRHEPQQSPPRALRQSLEQANREIHAAGERDLAYKGMGTTCSALVILPQGALIGHIGDSRVYRVRGRTVEQLSRDHSLAWEIAAASGPDANGAPPGVPKNIITRSMGPHHEADIDLEGPFPIAPGDHFILCSDGLSGCLSDEEIALFAAELPTPDATAALVNLALVRGAPDNTTVILATAGTEEATQTVRRQRGWPLDDTSSTSSRNRPWIFLVVAAVALFGALLLWGTAEQSIGLLRTGLRVGTAAAVGLTVGCLIAAALGFMTQKPAKRSRVLTPGHGHHLGKGPYRRFDASPTADLFAAIVASLESAHHELAQAGLTEAARSVDEALQAVRGRLQENDFSTATREAARGLASFAAALAENPSGGPDQAAALPTPESP